MTSSQKTAPQRVLHTTFGLQRARPSSLSKSTERSWRTSSKLVRSRRCRLSRSVRIPRCKPSMSCKGLRMSSSWSSSSNLNKRERSPHPKQTDTMRRRSRANPRHAWPRDPTNIQGTNRCCSSSDRRQEHTRSCTQAHTRQSTPVRSTPSRSDRNRHLHRRQRTRCTAAQSQPG